MVSYKRGIESTSAIKRGRSLSGCLACSSKRTHLQGGGLLQYRLMYVHPRRVCLNPYIEDWCS